MKINKAGGVDLSRLYGRLAAGREAGERPRTGESRAADSVELSTQARELQVYHQKLAELPAFREEVVERLKAEIRDGTYQPDPGRIAAGMLLEREVGMMPDER